MRRNIKSRNPEWKHEYYRISNTFSVAEKEGVDEFPHNNKKYNVQFAEKTLEGGTFNFPSQEKGYFTKLRDSLYSKHFIPIVVEKRKLNEDFELRTSLFGKTWVDHKRDKIMDEYNLQANPFSTPKSNQLICLMRPARKHRFSWWLSLLQSFISILNLVHSIWSANNLNPIEKCRRCIFYLLLLWS